MFLISIQHACELGNMECLADICSTKRSIKVSRHRSTTLSVLEKRIDY